MVNIFINHDPEENKPPVPPLVLACQGNRTKKIWVSYVTQGAIAGKQKKDSEYRKSPLDGKFRQRLLVMDGGFVAHRFADVHDFQTTVTTESLSSPLFSP
jgi:hypothetical protein